MAEKVTFKFKKGTTGGSIPTGLTHGELAVNTTDGVLFVGSVTGGENPLYNRTFIDTTQDPEGTWYPNRGDRWWTGVAKSPEKIWDGSSWVTTDPGLSGITITGATLTGGVTSAGGLSVFNGLNAASGGIFIYTDITKGTTGVTLSSAVVGTDHNLKVETSWGRMSMGPLDSQYSHFTTDRPMFYFNVPAQISNDVGSYNAARPFHIWTPTSSNGTTANRITVLTGPDSRLGGFVGIGTVTPQEKLDVNGNMIIRGELDVTGGGLTVGDGTDLFGIVKAKSGLSITGGATITGGFNQFGSGTLMSANGLFVITGGATISSGMDAFGIVSMGNGVSVTGGATVKDGSDFFGSVKINNGLSVTGGASFSGTTNFITASIANGLSVTGGETITGNTKFFGNMTINGNLTVNGTHPFGSGGSDFSPILITASYTNPTTAQWFTIDATGMSPGRWYHYELTYKRTAPTTVNVPLGIRFKGYTGHVYLLTDYAYAYKKWDSTLVIKNMSNLDSTTPGVASGITSSGLLLTNCIYCDGDVLIPTPWTVYLDQDNPPIYEGFFYMENSMYGTLGAGEFTIQYRTLRLV